MEDTTKAFGDGAHVRQFATITKVEEQDDGTIKVFGVASTGSKDSAGETITAAAMKAALPEYELYPALREMHQLSAAGRTLSAEVDDDGFTRIEVHVVDPVAVLKVKTGTYGGFSIGGKALARDPADRTIITKLKLNEISLVDRPCNPEATIDLWKADASTEGNHMSETPAPWAPTNKDVLVKAETLAADAGKPGRRNDYVAAARDSLLKAHADAEEATATAEVEAALAGDGGTEVVTKTEDLPVKDDVEAVAAEQVPGVEPEAPVDKTDVETPVAESEPSALDALEASIAKAATVAAHADATPDTDSPVTDGMEDFAKGLGELAASETVIAKGLYTVGRLAEIMQSLASIQSSCASEAAREGDGSTMPATLAASLQGLGAALVAMAQEEVAELLADLPEGMEVVTSDDCFYYAAKAIDIVKADTALVEKVGARNSKGDQTKLQAIHDNATKLGAKCESCDAAKVDSDDDIAKAARLEDTLAKATATIEDLTKRLENTPAPAKTVVTPAGLTAITKTEDAAGEPDAEPDALTKADAEAYIATLSPTELGALQMKAALSRPLQLGRHP